MFYHHQKRFKENQLLQLRIAQNSNHPIFKTWIDLKFLMRVLSPGQIMTLAALNEKINLQNDRRNMNGVLCVEHTTESESN